MRIRLHGHPDDLAHACHLLATVFDVDQISRLYPDRAPSPYARLYLDADLPTPPRPLSTPSPAPGDTSPGRRDHAHPARHRPTT